MLQHMSEFPSFLRLNNIPLYVHTTFCLSIYPLMALELRPLLTIVNNAAMNLGVRGSLQDPTFTQKICHLVFILTINICILSMLGYCVLQK